MDPLMQGDGPSAVEVTLEDWLAAHGPLWPDMALVIALEACAVASHLRDSELDALIGSLGVKRIIRDAVGGWTWKPARAALTAAGATDADVVERLGALLFHALTGRPVADALAGDATVRARLRNQRPDVAPAVTDLIVRALATRQSRPWPLEMFVRDVTQALGLVHAARRPRYRRRLALATASVALTAALAMWWRTVQASETIEGHGLTSSETALVDATAETAQTFALMDEHTAAIQQYQQLARYWSARIQPEDPRLAWNVGHEAWVRTLRGDRLTTEQLLGSVGGTTTGLTGVGGTAARLEATLGDRHPYTRTVRLALAATLDARGATAEATRLREQAAERARELVADPSVLLGVPAPPGVVAHLSPNPPEQEGFRRTNDGAYYTPLTSVQRLLSGANGWRLHLIAHGACRTDVVVGDPPRLIAVSASRASAGAWQLRVDGTLPPLTLDRPAADALRTSIIVNAHGMITLKPDSNRRTPLTIDAASAPPAPPYTLRFTEQSGTNACALVWLEIPFPFAPVPTP